MKGFFDEKLSLGKFVTEHKLGLSQTRNSLREFLVACLLKKSSGMEEKMILAIESSSLVASVAIADEYKIISEYTVNQNKTHSQTLLPMIDEIIKMTQINKEDIEAIAISGGPGSFTGLRIGSATAKGLALAWNIPIINVPTVDAMAYSIQFTNMIICPIMDARRNQVYTGIYKNKNGKLEILMEQSALELDRLLDILKQQNEPIIFLGDGVPVYSEQIDEKFNNEHYYAKACSNRQRAGVLATLAYEYLKNGKLENCDEHVPNYLRISQAERERIASDKKNGA